MLSRALLLFAAIVAAVFCSFSERTLALACEGQKEVEEGLLAAAPMATLALKNNRYNNINNNNDNSYHYDDYNNNNNNNEVYAGADAIADSGNGGDNNDNYNNYKASAELQKLHGYPGSILYSGSRRQQQQQQQQQQQLPSQRQQQQHQRQFDDDPEDARNDFRLQLSDLNEAVGGMGGFASQPAGHNINNNNNESIDEDNARQEEQEEQHAWLERHSRSSQGSQGSQRGRGQEEYVPESSYDIDIEGEEDYAVEDEAEAEADADELSAQLPYGIQNVRKRLVRSVMPPTQHGGGNEGVTYQSLCPTNRVTVKLDGGEYRPNHYVEVTCAHNYSPPSRSHSYRNSDLPLLRAFIQSAERAGEKREICSATGFSCIQLNRTIHLIRLNDDSGCWESETRTVPSGCECMWPKHSYGDIAFYHQTQKRFNPQTSLRSPRPGSLDYRPGLGYRELTVRSRGQSNALDKEKRGPRELQGYDIFE